MHILLGAAGRNIPLARVGAALGCRPRDRVRRMHSEGAGPATRLPTAKHHIGANTRTAMAIHRGRATNHVKILSFIGSTSIRFPVGARPPGGGPSHEEADEDGDAGLRAGGARTWTNQRWACTSTAGDAEDAAQAGQDDRPGHPQGEERAAESAAAYRMMITGTRSRRSKVGLSISLSSWGAAEGARPPSSSGTQPSLLPEFCPVSHTLHGPRHPNVIL